MKARPGGAAQRDYLTALLRDMTPAPPPAAAELFERLPPEHLSYAVIRVSAALHRDQMTHSDACVELLRGFQDLARETDFKRDARPALRQKLAALRAVVEMYGVLDFAIANICDFLAAAVEELPAEPLEEDRAALLAAIDTYVDRRFEMAEALLVEYCVQLISDGDALMICNASSILEKVLVAAHAQGRRFGVTLLGGATTPLNAQMARSLHRAGVPLLFAHVNNVAFFVDRADKVFINGLNVLADGSVQTAPGSAALALFAHKRRKPVYAVVRTVRFWDAVCADPLRHNRAEAWDLAPRAHRLLHDLIPAAHIDLLVTEVGLMPTHSVPVVIREGRTGGRW